MQNLVLLCAVGLWIFALINPQFGGIVFLLWLIAFVLIHFTWTNRYALLSLLAASSYHFSDLSHLNPFYAKIFPTICGIASFILFFALLFKLLANANGSGGGGGYLGSGGSDVGDTGGGCDSGGCGGGE